MSDTDLETVSRQQKIDALPIDGWRMDIGYPEDREEAERRLQAEAEAETEAETSDEEEEATESTTSD